MFPFDPLDGNTLAVLIPLIILLYAIILLKLRHNEEEKPQSDIRSPQAKRYPSETRMVQSPPAKSGAKQIPNRQQTPVTQGQKPLEQIPRKNLHDSLANAEHASVLDEEEQNKKKRKSFFLFGEQDFGGCHHKFGHLSTVAKNTPIPEECFGCSEILDCMKTKTDKK